MKAIKSIYLYASNIEVSNNFKNRIAAVLPDYVTDLTIEEAGIERASGYGQYKFFLYGVMNGESFKFTRHSTDSPLWDWYHETDANRAFSNWKKNFIISLLESYIETL